MARNRKSAKNMSKACESQETNSKAPNKSNGFNDYTWYNNNPLLSEAVGRIPFPYRPGMDMEKYADPKLDRKVPGIAALHWVPSVGQSSLPTDPASIAAREIFSKVRSVFSGSIDAGAPDFVIYMLALDSIFSYIGSLKRIYRILDAYTPENYTWPGALLATLLPYDQKTPAATVINNFRENKAQLWQYINELIGMTKKFRCPDIFPLFKRHYWMNDNVYTDAPTPNSQSYVFVQDAFYRFGLTEVSSVQVGCVRLAQPQYKTPREAFEFGRTLIDSLGNGDDAYIISGYLTRAYQDTGVFFVDELASDEVFTPYYLPEVLEQIHNAMTITFQAKASSINASCTVSQDPLTNAIVSAPKNTDPTNVAFIGITPKLSVMNPSPTAIDVIEASRLSAYLASDGTIIAGTEIPTYWALRSSETVGAGDSFIAQAEDIEMAADKSAPVSWEPSVSFSWLETISAFDWAPRFVITATLTGETKPYDAYEIWEVKNTTTLSENDLSQINRICLLSEFNVFS